MMMVDRTDALLQLHRRPLESTGRDPLKAGQSLPGRNQRRRSGDGFAAPDSTRRDHRDDRRRDHWSHELGVRGQV